MTSLHLCFTLLSTNVLANNNVNATQPIRILAYGDSLTAGYRLPPSDSYPKQLETLLRADGMNVEIINGGVSGDTSAQALSRLTWSLNKGPFDYVLLCIGANDGLRQQPVAALENNLRKMIQEFQKKNIQVILLGMQLPTNFSPAYRNAFAKTYPKIAKEFKLSLYPFILEDVTQKPALNLNDTIHPNKAGYTVIAKNLHKFLKPILKK
jgi:acyl-CoA thioesterase I